MQMGQQPQQPAVFVSELKKDFTVEEVPMTATNIDDNIKVLLVDHPRDITDAGAISPLINSSCAAAK